MSDARRYAVWPEPRTRSRSLNGSRPSVPHGTNFYFPFNFTAVPASLTVVRKLTVYTRNESSQEGNIRSWEQKGTFVLRSESSWELQFLGAKVPIGNFRFEEWKYWGAKSPDTLNVEPWAWELSDNYAEYYIYRGRNLGQTEKLKSQ